MQNSLRIEIVATDRNAACRAILLHKGSCMQLLALTLRPQQKFGQEASGRDYMLNICWIGMYVGTETYWIHGLA